jgi:hypothetical protein
MNGLIGVGIVAALLARYAWLVPVPQAYVALASVATGCAAVAVALTVVRSWQR